MCGIAGYISEDLLDGQRMIEVISHRGPDSSSTYHIQRGRHNVFLGHQRLSIIDLSDAGRQPMSTPGDEVTITFNGEIYNYNELRAQYLRGYEFRSKTDTEVRSEEHTSELQSRENLVCRLLLEKKKKSDIVRATTI